MSSQGSEELDLETFGPLVSIPETALVQLATKFASTLVKRTSPGRAVSRIAGSYNLVHIIQLSDDFKLVIRVPATGWGQGQTAAAAQAMKSHVATLRLIASKTGIPMSEVYGFDTSANNEIGAPYICMSFLPGKPASNAWFDSTLPTDLEQRRLKTLSTLSQAMAQLSQFSFPKIGSLYEDERGDLKVGPCYDWRENEDGSVRVDESGPYDTISAYLDDHYAKTDTTSLWGVAEAKVAGSIVRYLPLQSEADGFVLSVPDFNSQNILVDDEGNLTGVIDWDLVQTLPRCVGYCRYPGWITRDWDPLMYGWPKLGSENSPDELVRYRAYYNQIMGQEMGHSGDWKLSEKSHIREAVWIAALNGANRLEICRKLIQEATHKDKEQALGILYEIGTGNLDQNDWQKFEIQLEQLIS